MLAGMIKALCNFRGKPYFLTVIKNNPDGVGVNISAEFNPFFIHELDKAYLESRANTYKPTAPDNEKVALYLYDVISGIADEYIREEMLPGLEYEEDIPIMDLRDSGISPQVIELGDGKGKIDFEAG